ncbi:MAG: MBOAT family protein, partial [Oscillospiraceae bacterium]|nr:MBOAT family protein [Oscillospiraceae bacterium]
MVFSSALFLFAFFPVVFLAHLLIKDIRARNILLLAASLFFYSVGEPIYVALMAVSIALNYFFGVMICRSHAKAWVAIGITVDLAILAVFKYTDFIISIINAALKVNIPFSGIGLPIGISFFTFQAMSYIIDVYRDRSLVQRNILKLALYISFFPQLIAGPIIQYSDIAAEIDSRTVTADGAAEGLRRFIIGLAKKIIIANTVGYAADFIFGMN